MVGDQPAIRDEEAEFEEDFDDDNDAIGAMENGVLAKNESFKRQMESTKASGLISSGMQG
jgi:hypothetical protein